MTWWCSATGVPWTWHWRAYPGVWLFATLLVAAYVLLRGGPTSAGARAQVGQVAAFTLGIMSVWLALDWPIGALGAGYLLCAHTGQYLLLSFVAAPLLILSVPAEAARRLAARRAVGGLVHFAARPLPALALYNLVLVLTHLPVVVDGLMRRQLGSFGIDFGWLLAGLGLWWPVLAPTGISRLAPPVKLGYLFASTILPTAPAAFLTFADYPIYSLYELAPRVSGIAALADQQVAGLAMKLAADPIIWLAMGIIFFRWSAEESDAAPTPLKETTA